jgi:hypothetical protein
MLFSSTAVAILASGLLLNVLKWSRITNEPRGSHDPIILIGKMFPDSVMFPIHSPPACIDQRQEGLFFGANTD